MPTPLSETQLDHLFSALANRTRRAMLQYLGQSPATISDLALPFKMSLPAVSKHLRVLERAGLVQRNIDGRTHHCSLNTQALQHAEAWLVARRTFWEQCLDALADHVEKNP